MQLWCGASTACQAGGNRCPQFGALHVATALPSISLSLSIPCPVPPSPRIYGFGIWCVKGSVLFSLSSKPKTICCDRWQQAGILRARYFYHGGWTLELNLEGREGENTQYCLGQRRERLVNCWHIFKFQENHQGGNKSTKNKTEVRRKRAAKHGDFF